MQRLREDLPPETELDLIRDDGNCSSASDLDSELEDSRTTGLSRSISKKRRASESSLDSQYATDEPDHHVGQLSSTPPSSRAPRILLPLKSTSKRGVIYISRIPPYLKPHTLRQMISVHGTVTNLFLTPEPPTAYHHRVHTHRGNKKRQYIDGWVEFKHRRHARACVDALNGKTTAEGLGVGAIGGRKGGKGRWYRDDVWSVRYLKGFSWDDLMESARTEEREREEKIRFGLVKEKKERQAFMDGIQHAKVEKTRAAKRKRKDEENDRPGKELRANRVQLDDYHGFNQHKARGSEHDGSSRSGEELHRVLSKIF